MIIIIIAMILLEDFHNVKIEDLICTTDHDYH